jgi:hypothetical protein
MRRGKLSVHISEVKKVFKNFAIEMSAESLEDLKEANVTLKLQVSKINVRKLWVPTTIDKPQATKSVNKRWKIHFIFGLFILLPGLYVLRHGCLCDRQILIILGS